MKRLVSVSLFLSICLVSYSQIIKGTILDKETKSPVNYATVYFNATSVGSYSDENGFFKLDIKNLVSMPLTISALGYYSTSITDYSPDKNIVVYLEPKVFNLTEVVVSAKKNPTLRKEIDIFRREFLGKTKNAKECEITNLSDILFVTSEDKDTLNAIALKPIVVINRGLGYRIIYFLNKFEYVKSTSCVLVGSALFEEDSTSISGNQEYESRRINAYYGSKMHFFRSLYRNDLSSSGYVIKNSKRVLTYQDLVRVQLSNDPDKIRKYILYSEPRSEIILIKWSPEYIESGMEILNSPVYFNKNGYFEGQNVIWHGVMATHQVADLLPYDYEPTRSMEE